MGITYQSFNRALFLSRNGATVEAVRQCPHGGKYEVQQVRRGAAQGFEVMLVNPNGSYLGHIGRD